jgi:hypothetical protein
VIEDFEKVKQSNDIKLNLYSNLIGAFNHVDTADIVESMGSRKIYVNNRGLSGFRWRYLDTNNVNTFEDMASKKKLQWFQVDGKSQKEIITVKLK